MSGGDALLDTNVIVALVDVDHAHHGRSAALVPDTGGAQYAVAAHSIAEAYSTLTRRGKGGAFQWTSAEAWESLRVLSGMMRVLGLSPAQTFDAVRDFADLGGVGPRLYDRLIGEVAVRHRIPVIVTWNAVDFRSLFPSLSIQTPPEYLIPRR